jgi:alpha-glucosidase
VAWHGVPTLPKLDHRSDALRERFYGGADSVVAHYLDEPFGLDGWRVDCANTTARFRAHDHNSDVARLTRSTMRAVDPDSWLVAEHCYDSGDDLDGTGWHGVMAYQWFTRPLWAWLKDPAPRSLMAAVELIDLDGNGLVESMRHLSANVSWEARQASMTMLDSHDTARFRTVVGGDVTRHLVGLVALLTMPGVPTLFAGSELGCEGNSIDTTRVPFPWDVLAAIDDQQSATEARFLGDVRALVELRRRSVALRHGSMRWIDATPDSVTFVREAPDETVLVHLVRGRCEERTFTGHDIDVIGQVGTDGRCTVEFGDPELVDVGPARGRPGTAIVLPGVPGAYVVSCARR